ncbi:Hypothetical predicted protein [Podarcis lilfordi]|uniref:Uncharacterized protein n=1 Tax=Podarcis lilfordi TaxID=74358 RepID=A0AA35P7P8_9SAUR|nr:Hypothetical predicted protein [Podarcis lilfordi]
MQDYANPGGGNERGLSPKAPSLLDGAGGRPPPKYRARSLGRGKARPRRARCPLATPDRARRAAAVGLRLPPAGAELQRSPGSGGWHREEGVGGLVGAAAWRRPRQNGLRNPRGAKRTPDNQPNRPSLSPPRPSSGASLLGTGSPSSRAGGGLQSRSRGLPFPVFPRGCQVHGNRTERGV